MTRRERERRLEAELHDHIERHAAELAAGGMDAAEASRQARIAFGGIEAVREECREARGVRWLATLGQDLRYAIRQLRRAPSFTAVALLMLALGIGANAAIFAVIEGLILRPLPYRDPGRWVQMWDDYGSPGNAAPVSYPDYLDWRNWNHSFTGLITRDWGDQYTLTGRGEARIVSGLLTSANTFRELGAQPFLGRVFRPEEDRPAADSGTDAVILSYGLWQRAFGGSRSVLGGIATLSGQPFTVVGVMPRGFDYPPGQNADLWTTIAPLLESHEGAAPCGEKRDCGTLVTFGHLRPGVTLAMARADMDQVASMMRRVHPKLDHYTGVTMAPWNGRSPERRALLLLMAAAAGVLLIACANLAGLLLARAVERRHEMGIRAALGASRARLIRQLMTEGLLLGAAGALLGGLVAALAIPALNAGTQAPTDFAARLDFGVLCFATGMALLAILLFALAPAWRAARSAPMAAVKLGARTAGRMGRSWTHRGMTVAQIAVAMVLVATTGLALRSLLAVEQVDPGCDPHHVLLLEAMLPERQYPASSWARFYDRWTRRLRALPGVVSVAAGSAMPLSGGGSFYDLRAAGGIELDARTSGQVVMGAVTPGYFSTLRIRLLRGREFAPSDAGGSPPVAIVNEATARRFFPHGDALGQTIEPTMGPPAHTIPRTIVGVVADVKTTDEPLRSRIYLPLAQAPTTAGAVAVMIRTRGPSLGLVGPARATLRKLDPDLALTASRLNELYRTSFADSEFISELLGAFAALAMLLTAAGVYGVIAFQAARERPALAIRMALGASRNSVLGRVLRQSAGLAAAGVALGLAGALALTGFLRPLLFGIRPNDPVTLGAVAFILCVVVMAAGYLPARRAARLDPMTVLRSE